MKKRYVLDANAVIGNLEGRAGSDKVRKIMESAAQGEAELFMSVINVGEVFAALWKRHGEVYARQAIEMLLSAPVQFIDATLPMSLEAAAIRAKYHAGTADCFAALTAMKKKASLVTADPDFKRFGDKLKILWLPSQKSIH